MAAKPFDPDPDVTVREWFRENSRRRSGQEAAKRRVAQVNELIPHVLLDAPATEVNCQNLALILATMEENSGETSQVTAPSALDISPYEHAKTVGDLIRRYISLHAPEDFTEIVEAFGEAFSADWDRKPSGPERRRWVATMRQAWPPDFLREQAEATRLSMNLPGRN